ncbi:MAG: hypothetical protein LPK14_13495, partial [Hymenobacteraceae bacterium]|nr:hypothetical protein [Hymenobacteraceae bacterium]
RREGFIESLLCQNCRAGSLLSNQALAHISLLSVFSSLPSGSTPFKRANTLSDFQAPIDYRHLPGSIMGHTSPPSCHFQSLP